MRSEICISLADMAPALSGKSDGIYVTQSEVKKTALDTYA